MEDKTPIYIMMMVGIVAVVAIVYMMTGSSANTSDSQINVENGVESGITGNAITDDIEPVDLSTIGRGLLAVILIGTAVFMYKQSE
jgi:hypothetical protein